MHIIYARQPLPKSIFLAGPTPRSSDVDSWRPEAIKLLSTVCGFTGTVFAPEDDTGERAFEYDDQVSWEWEALNLSTVVVFWIPRTLDNMPAFTTNVEFGMLVATGKVVLGAPDGAAKMGYLKAVAERYNVPIYTTLVDTLQEAVRRTKCQFGRFE